MAVFTLYKRTPASLSRALDRASFLPGELPAAKVPLLLSIVYCSRKYVFTVFL